MNVLQDSQRIIGRDNAKIFLHLLLPNMRQVLDRHLALHHSNLQFKPEHDMKIIGGFISINTDQRRLHFVDGFIESFQIHIAELGWKYFFKTREEISPERQGTAH